MSIAVPGYRKNGWNYELNESARGRAQRNLILDIDHKLYYGNQVDFYLVSSIFYKIKKKFIAPQGISVFELSTDNITLYDYDTNQILL